MSEERESNSGVDAVRCGRAPQSRIKAMDALIPTSPPPDLPTSQHPHAPTPPHPHAPTSFHGAARLAYFSPINQQPGAADRKAAFLLATTGLILTTLLSFFGPILDILNGQRGHAAAAPILLALLIGLAALLLAASCLSYLAFVLIGPPPPDGTLCVIDQIAALSAEEYARRMRALDHAAAMEAVLHVNYGAAVQGAEKFRLVNRALACMRLALPMWMLILLLIAAWR